MPPASVLAAFGSLLDGDGACCGGGCATASAEGGPSLLGARIMGASFTCADTAV